MFNIFNYYRISNKIAAVFLILLIMMGIGGSVGLYNARQIATITTRFYTDFFIRQDTISSIERELLRESNEVWLYLADPDKDSRAALEHSLTAHSRKIEELLEKHLTIEKKERDLKLHTSRYTSFDNALSDYTAARDEALRFSRAGNIEKARLLFREDGAVKFASVMDMLQKFLSEEWDFAFVEYQRAKRLADSITRMTLSFAILAVIISIGLWALLTRAIVRPVEKLHEATKGIELGKFGERVSIGSRDEIGSLAAEFNKMAEYLENYYADILKKKQEMEILNEELTRASKMKSQFVATVSHELRTPLNSIIGFSELLMEKSFGDLNEKQMQYVNYINTSGSHLSDLINDILDLSKIEAGRLELAYEKFVVEDIIDEILASIKPMANRKGVTIERKGATPSAMVMLDRSKFKQVMLNLISNAVKFNKEGGRVDIDWGIVEEPKGTNTERVMRVSVKDTGIGIKHEDIPRIFKEFEQLDQSVTRDYGGTGLGLALTKRLIELHQGRIWFDSEYGKGTTFSFTIPQAIEGDQPPGEAERIGVSALYQQSPWSELICPVILVASGSESLNELIKEYLIENSYCIELANTGIEVLEKVRQIQPFAIILDIELPVKDGWDVLKELKASPETDDAPVIIISSANEKELGFSLGAVDYLEKPVQKDKLLSTLGRLSLTQRIMRYPFSILAIDDEPQVLQFLGDILEQEGFNVLTATNGEDGVALAIERDPDLIILDLMMPRVSGFDVVGRLREHPTARDIPIVIFTAKDITAADKAKLGDNITRILKKADFSKKSLLNEIKKLEMAYPAKAKVIDPLTRTFNQRYFNSWTMREIARSNRYGLPFGILMIDVDRLMNYNEKNGFLLGNEMLADLARLIESNIRKPDCLIRYHGDCFILLLPGITKEAAAVVGEKLRIRIFNHAFPSSDGKRNGRISISVGVADFPMDGKDPNGLLTNVSQAVKSAFQRGGNKVSVFKKA